VTERLLTAEEVASTLAVPTSWVYRQAREGAIPSVQLGRYVRFEASDIESWISAQKTNGGKP
jgi:excisionase family DNA binding protein